jgi:hypothetical protein
MWTMTRPTSPNWAALFRPREEPVSAIISGYERRLWQVQRENGELRAAVIGARDQLAIGERERGGIRAALAKCKQEVADQGVQATRHGLSSVAGRLFRKLHR